jgi:hypothetical protein
VLWLAVALSLLPVLGVGAVGLGWLVASGGDSTVLARAAARRARARTVRPLLAPLAAALASGGAGWAIASAGHATVARGVVALVVAEGALLGGLALAARPALGGAWRLMFAGLREARAPEA